MINPTMHVSTKKKKKKKKTEWGKDGKKARKSVSLGL